MDSGLVKFKFKSFDEINAFVKDDEKMFEKFESLTQKAFRHKNKKLVSVKLPWAELGIFKGWNKKIHIVFIFKSNCFLEISRRAKEKLFNTHGRAKIEIK